MGIRYKIASPENKEIFTIGTTKLPNRKGTYLFVEKNAKMDLLASFVNENAVKEFEEALERIVGIPVIDHT